MLDRLSRGLRSVQRVSARARASRAPGSGVANASIGLRGRIAQASAGIEPALSWQPAGVNAVAFNITAHYTKLSHSFASLSRWVSRFAPCGFV